ncbi:MAG: cytochrome c [Deltaproteobacteria bacterium]|nr:cytochrome c [Deltaproteobacteria bacterium]
MRIAERIKLAVIVLIAFFAVSSASLPAQADKRLSKAYETVQDLWQLTYGGRKIVCGGPISGKYYSGTGQSLSNGALFTPGYTKVKDLKSKFKKATGSKRTSLKKKLDKLNKKVKSDDKICAEGPDSEPPVVAPTPTQAPTATPTPGSGNFDSNGNVTSAGKAAFGIPSSLNANRESGRSIYNASCKGCHVTEEQGKSFSFYKIAIQSSPMFIFDKSDGDVAHLTAYLNRFKLN